MRYNQAYDGEWIQPVMKGYKMSCCDCGLVHVLNFKIVGKKIQLQAFRDNRASSSKRRNPKYSFKKITITKK